MKKQGEISKDGSGSHRKGPETARDGAPDHPGPNPIVMEFALRMGIASSQFQAVMEQRLAPHDLTPQQLNVLSHVARHGPCRVTDIARVVQVKQPAVTKMLAKFERSGWITNVDDPKDRRSRAARLTPQGGAHLMQVQRGLIPELPGFVLGQNADDIRHFTKMLQAFSAFLDDLTGPQKHPEKPRAIRDILQATSQPHPPPKP
jgi:DNA-binding MarR family transcriptional regulator